MRNRLYSLGNTRYLPVVLATALVALGFALRLHSLERESLWYDELLQLDIAQGSLPLIFSRLRGHSAVPLDYLVAHFWILGGRGEAWVRFPAVIWGTLTLPLLYQLGKRLLGKEAGLLGMALLAVSPFHIRYSQEVRPYALMVLGVVLTVYAYWRLRETGRWLYLLSLQLGILGSWLSHIFALPIWGMLAVFGLIDLIFPGTDRSRPVKPVAGLLLAGFLPLVILLGLGWGDLLFYSSQQFGQALVGPERSTFGPDQEIDPAGMIDRPVNWAFVQEKIIAPLGSTRGVVGLFLLNGLVGLGLLSFLWQRRYKRGLLLLLWLFLPPLLLVSFLFFREAFFVPRYVSSILPAYLLLVVAGLSTLARLRGRFEFRVVSIVGVVLVAGFLLFTWGREINRYYRQPDKEDWRLVASFVAANAGPHDAIIAFHAEPAINWYYPPAWTAPNYFQDLETIQEKVAGSNRSWVILSIFSSDYDAQVKAWLSEQQAVRFALDPVIHLYYLGPDIPRDRLLAEIQDFALPVDHALYASLARENRRKPAVARRYYELAIQHAPDAETKAAYRAALEALAP